MFRYACIGVVVFLAAVPVAVAFDPWEDGFVPGGDDGAFTLNELGHGTVQQHDMEGPEPARDQDWYRVLSLPRHSYEARVFGYNGTFEASPGACALCAQFDRVDSFATVLTQDVGHAFGSMVRSIRWIGSSAQPSSFLRVIGDRDFGTAFSVYSIAFWDTTYAIPRWNQVGTQGTVIVIANRLTQATGNPSAAVNGNIHFFNAAGALLHSQPFAVPAEGSVTLLLNSIPALTNQSGHATVAHDGGYGALSGKAVSIEPATGFTFDTLMEPLVD